MTAMVPRGGTWLRWSTACVLILASLLPQLHGQPTNETNSNWNPWTDGICSRTCGGGVMKSTRTCTDRSNKGCHGNKVKYTSCNTQDCPDDTDFRSLQCADFNQKPVKDLYYEWVPYLGDDADRCTLVCSAVNGTLRETMKEKVVDGTPCNAHGTEVCVDGTCKSVGCDRVLGSTKVEDACRICGGEGKHCKTVKKSVETTKLKKGYNDFLVIPRGATNILVKNRKDSDNHFALRTNRGKFILNGKWTLVNYSKFHRYGTTFYYINDGKHQQLSAVGPISTNLILVLVVEEKTADIEYEYSIQKEGETSTVILRHLEPSPPLKELHSTSKQSNDSQKVFISSEMGASRIRVHHRNPELTVNPPRDQEPLMSLPVKEAARGSADGVDDDGSDDDDVDRDIPVDADDGDDDDDHKMTNRKFAFVPIDPNLNVVDDVQGLRQFEWNYGAWTECSVSCGAGVQRRVVMCYDVYKRENVPERCDRTHRPAATKACQVNCNIKIRWVQSGWTECSETCDGGQMSSIVKCMEMSGNSERQVGDNLCIEREGAARRLTKKCNEQACERIPWPERPCWETVYGCCPDRQTAAEGPGHAGCSTPTSCLDSRYGCCPDRVSYARGPNHAGCPGCHNTDYGCCPDGVTTAEGPHYAGCSSGTTASDHCSLAQERGTCSDYTQKWAFDTETGSCKQFWYGGCGGNKNRFDTQRDCLIACRDRGRRPDPRTRTTYVPTRVPTRRPPVTSTDVHCAAESDRGTCSDYTQKWAYDTETRRCKQFWYGGCGGNTNRFDDERACLEACRSYRPSTDSRTHRTRRPTPAPTRPPVTHGDVHCAAESDRGTCSDYTQKWAYDTETRRCKQFWYGGCGGNTNRFDDERACLEACRSYRPSTDSRTYRTRRPTPAPTRAPVTSGGDHCSLAQERGTCSDYTQKWAFDTESGSCKQFWYGGCGGNKNRFDTQRDCLVACRNYRSRTTSRPTTRRRGCQDTHYGCCEDRQTAARGPNKEGCPERTCAGSAYGCCPDGVTFARGPEYEGCRDVRRGCEATQYGCCPDGATAARGPDYKGCRLIGGCAGTRYGCCADGSTAARGEDRLGCPERQTCRDSAYGCCPDGVRSAHGPNYHGCEPHVTEGDCTSDKDSGTCSNHAIKWYYNRASSTCEQFWYGGCRGNGNRYETKEDCQRKCRHRSQSQVASTTPSVADDVCKLPKAVGNCRARKLRWYFDHETLSCQKFYYTGCHGNGNNFVSEQQCVHRCFAPNPIIQFTIPPNEKELSRDPLVVCHLGVDAGACDDQFVMWYYDAQEGECKTFNYTGCYGNSNRYKTKQSCEALCNRDTVCNFPEAYGQCDSKLRRFRYDEEQKDCIPFRYSGCNGNANNFYSAEACRKKCGVISEVPTTTVSPDDPTGICQLKQDSGTCYAYSKQWFFNMASKQCEEFAYGGCGGNANRFATLETCQRACQPFLAKPTVPIKKEKPTDVCSLLEKPSPCDAIGPSWYYNMTSGTCEKATPGYCLNNHNSFKTKEACEYLCDPEILCQMPAEPGLCYAYMPHYFYNNDTKQCERFVYGGCGGNANRFPTLDTCNAVCKSKEKKKLPQTPSARYCHLKEEVGSCTDIMYKWYYNMDEDRCKKFLYSGCGGNNNRYESKEECEKICQPKDLCSLPEEPGICYAYSEQYYFNMDTRQCEKFVYGGCGGNANRFASIHKCEQLCSAFVVKPITTRPTSTWSPTKPKDVCQMPKEPGNCYSYSEQYFFNGNLGRCERFVYGGCGGNANRFATLLECHNTCEPKTPRPSFTFPTPSRPKPVPTVNQTKPTPKPEVCHLQKIVGPCSHYTTAWYHDSLQGVCSQFKYSGCGGNQNNFKTREECEKACKPENDLCDLPRNTGRCQNITRRWHFSKKENRCVRFAYTGCGGNANNFETEDECRDACKAPGESAKDVCHFTKEIGSCKGAIPSWYYDMSVGQCKIFLYGGCEGNKNRFKTKYECEAICNKHDICRLPEDSGICYAYSTAYFYDSNMKKCRKFVYGGCGGNANRFPTMGDCYNLCGPNATSPRNQTDPLIPGPISVKQPRKCKLPASTGSCQDIRRMWYYDHVKEQCDQFFYSGCGGNDNRFHTELDCLASCRVKTGPEMLPPTIYTLPPFLTVTPASNIIKLAVDLKKKVVLQCGEAVGYTVTWNHNGKDIFPDNRHDVRGWELVIHDVDYKDVGLYTCRRNDDITDRPLERYQLNIKDSLQLIVDKNLNRYHEGDTIKLKCHTNGYPYTELQWYNKNYPIRSQGRITANEGMLMIDRATFDDSGIYTCKGKYRNEQVGKDVRVHVLPKPNEVSDECLNVLDILPSLQCRIIVSSELCDQRAFRTQCCASCKKHRNVIS